jgi:hypothetical protein
MFPYKKSGYYWIKPWCSKVSLRVYCDFESEHKQAYAFLKNSNEDMSSLMKIRHWCGTLGLEPIEIDPKRIDNIVGYLNDIGLDLMSQYPVPLGYDYGCLKGKCNGIYRSFSRSNSGDIS